MPAKSQAQWRWLHTASAKKALGKSGQAEWIGATGSPSNLPEKKSKWQQAADKRRKHGQ